MSFPFNDIVHGDFSLLNFRDENFSWFFSLKHFENHFKYISADVGIIVLVSDDEWWGNQVELAEQLVERNE